MSTPMTMTVAPPTHPATTKRDWHATTTLHMRRRVLLQILLLLKTKYGKVDAKISFIARRAEVALYSQAFSLREYRNPKTLHRRLHSLVLKLHVNNLAAREDAILHSEAPSEPVLQTPTYARKRSFQDDCCVSPVASTKRRRTTSSDGIVKTTPRESTLFFNGNHDLMHHVCSFLATRDQLCLSTTNTSASRVVPQFATRIRVAVAALEQLAPHVRTSFFDRFERLEELEVFGDEQSHFDFQNDAALVRRNAACHGLVVALARQPLLRLRCVRWQYAFVDGVSDRITSHLADVLLDTASFPRLNELSLVGNAVSDDGVASLCNSLRVRPHARSLQMLNLEHNFVGERGHVELARLVENERQRNGGREPLAVLLRGNLLASAFAMPV